MVVASRRPRRPGRLEQSHARLKHTNLLRLDVLVHALPLQPAGARAFAWTIAFLRRRRAKWAQDEVVELRQHRRRQQVNLQFDLLRAL